MATNTHVRRERERDTRDYDKTQLHAGAHGRIIHRDYSAHFFRWSFARRMITIKDDVLEIGCGEERPLASILTGGVAPHVKTYTGVDLNKLKVSNSQRLTFLGEFNFVEEYKKLAKMMPKGYDKIVHFEVIEHMEVKHGEKMLKACFDLLKPGGTMLMSTPCYDGRRHAANHIHEYTVPELQKAAEKAGFIVERRFGTFMDIRHIGKAKPVLAKSGKQTENDITVAVNMVKAQLAEYYDNDAISCFFAPLYPDNARNNLWVCRKPATSKGRK